MELVEKQDGKWYWFFDIPGLPFAESIDYDSKNEALLAALENRVEWAMFCDACDGMGYVEYDIGGGNIRREVCDVCHGKGEMLK